MNSVQIIEQNCMFASLLFPVNFQLGSCLGTGELAQFKRKASRTEAETLPASTRSLFSGSMLRERTCRKDIHRSLWRGTAACAVPSAAVLTSVASLAQPSSSVRSFPFWATIPGSAASARSLSSSGSATPVPRPPRNILTKAGLNASTTPRHRPAVPHSL